MFFRKKDALLAEKDQTITQKDIEIQRLQEALAVSQHKSNVLEQVLNLLPNTGTFIVGNIQQGVIEFSNDAGKELVHKATKHKIIDGQTSIHKFHKTPERSKTILGNMPTGGHNNNTTMSIGETVIKSTSHKFEVDGKSYFLGLFSDGTPEAREIQSINFLRNNLENLLKIFLTYSTMGVNFKILLKDLEEAKAGILEQKDLINGTLDNVIIQFDTSNALFDRIKKANQDVATIFKTLGLLSLNGQIEAARQGEHGRGFAIVAE